MRRFFAALSFKATLTLRRLFADARCSRCHFTRMVRHVDDGDADITPCAAAAAFDYVMPRLMLMMPLHDAFADS